MASSADQPSGVRVAATLQMPLVLHQAVALRTQDPDLADRMTSVPQAIINAQKVTAENEFDTIRRRAVIGQVIPVGVDDVHQDHIPVHLLDMQALLGRHDVEPWKKIDVLHFAGIAQHAGEHLQILLANPETNPEGKKFLQDYQNLTQAAQAIVAEVEEQEGAEDQKLTAKEQAEMELKMAQEQRKWVELGVKLEENDRVNSNRQAREMISKRSQYAKEVSEAQRLDLDRKRVAVQAAAANKAPGKDGDNA